MTQTLTGRRVLVVEDEYLIAMDLCYYLDREGATVLGPIPSVDDALAVVDKLGEVDVAILDVNLRGEEVYPVVDVLAERRIPFLFATGYDALGIPERYRSVPRCGKPIRPESVVAAVCERLSKH